MKRMRILILVLLAVLLPIRGAMAAAMLCPQTANSDAAVVVTEHGHHEVRTGAGMQFDHSTSHHHASGAATDAGPSTGGEQATCQFCASGCCMASLVGSVTSMGPPDVTASITFPALSAPVPAFHSDGQDRPPRTL